MVQSAAEQQVVARFSRELTRLADLFGDDPRRLHQHPAFAWTAPLALADRLDMQRDYACGLIAGVKNGDWSQLEEAEISWQATAEVAGDAALSASLLAPRDPAHEIIPRRP